MKNELNQEQSIIAHINALRRRTLRTFSSYGLLSLVLLSFLGTPDNAQGGMTPINHDLHSVIYDPEAIHTDQKENFSASGNVHAFASKEADSLFQVRGNTGIEITEEDYKDNKPPQVARESLSRAQEQYSRIASIYASEVRVLYPTSFQELMDRSGQTKSPINPFINVRLRNERSEDDARIFTKTATLLLGSNTTRVVRSVSETGTASHVFAYVDPSKEVIGFGLNFTSFRGDLGAKRKTAIHEVIHLIDLSAGNYDLETRIRMETLKAEAFALYDPFYIFDTKYWGDIDSYYAQDGDGNFVNPLYKFGFAVINSFERNPDLTFFDNSEIQTEFINKMLEWQSNGWSHQDILRIGRLTVENRMLNPRFLFPDSNLESWYTFFSSWMLMESWPALVDECLSGNGSAINQDKELKELMRQYLELASGRNIDNIDELIYSLRWEGGLWETDDPINIRYPAPPLNFEAMYQ